MKKIFFMLFVIIFGLTSLIQAKGNLVIIGGGSRPDYVMEKIIELSGGPDAKIVIIPVASSEPLDRALYQRHSFETLGALNTTFVIFDSTSVDYDENLAVLDGATGIFFSGGDQRRLANWLHGTKMLRKIRDIYEKGGVVSGTSAGAAVMSELMITGDELINDDPEDAYDTIMKGNMELKKGFGFINTVIVDQHFIVRRRENRLFSLMLENPDLLGIGIDESTAIIVRPENTFDVLGESLVMIFDPTQSKNIKMDKNDNLSAENIIIHILQSGQKFDLKSKKVIEGRDEGR